VWLYCTLNFFTIRREIFDRVGEVLSATMSVGTINLSLGDVLVFLLTLFLGVTAAKVIRVLLREDVIPRFSLKRGLPAAVSTLIYYTLVTVVFFLAVAAGGAEFSRFTVLTGAFGLGVGFGLQTVINNLASGMLLLLERPINVGDVLEVDGVDGVVKRIGMRSSTIRTSQGAEVIVPNSDLVTNRVTNWTLSERNRRVDIAVGVAYGTDPELVIKLLVDTASSHPDVVQELPPEALFLGFGDSSLNFELRFWAPFAKTHQQLKSAVAVRIISAFREAGIEIPFPQTELHIKSLDSSIGKTVVAAEQGPDVVPQQIRAL
jgi:small-conductance mechanosensitive channel